MAVTGQIQKENGSRRSTYWLHLASNFPSWSHDLQVELSKTGLTMVYAREGSWEDISVVALSKTKQNQTFVDTKP